MEEGTGGEERSATKEDSGDDVGWYDCGRVQDNSGGGPSQLLHWGIADAVSPPVHVDDSAGRCNP